MTIPEVLKRINENSRLLSDGSLTEIDRDILLEDIRHLYLLAKGMDTNVSPVVQSQAQVVESPPAAKVIATPEPPLPQVQVEEPPMPTEEKPAEVIQRTKLKEDTLSSIEETIQFVPDKPKEETRTKPSSLNEVFAGEEKSLNARMGGTKKPALNDQVGGTDLKNMIDFNKQYILTNELFKGDSQAFQAAVKRINESPTIEAAFEFIKTELMPRYKWGSEMQSARLFDKLVRQKFGIS